LHRTCSIGGMKRALYKDGVYPGLALVVFAPIPISVLVGGVALLPFDVVAMCLHFPTGVVRALAGTPDVDVVGAASGQEWHRENGGKQKAGDVLHSGYPPVPSDGKMRGGRICVV
jgi:hypothetical protein